MSENNAKKEFQAFQSYNEAMDEFWSTIIPPKCHFKYMNLEGGEYGESWFECKYCGHTKVFTPARSGER